MTSVLHEIRAEQIQQRAMLSAILRLLERDRGARDQADAALLVAIAEAMRDGAFTSAQVMARAAADQGLHEAVRDADITNPRELGHLLRRLTGMPISGLRLERVDSDRGGAIWRVRVCEL